MDGDDFSRATRLGHIAAESAWEAIVNDAPLDGFATGQLIDRFVEHAGGIPSLPSILALLADLASKPLFVQARADEALARITEAVHGSECSTLDLQLGQVVESAVLRNQIDPQPILQRFFQGFIERNIIMSRGGFVETYGLQHARAAQALTAPIARAAADEMLRRPGAKRLGLSREFFQRLSENSNLLGVA
jgi:hypothetical protein